MDKKLLAAAKKKLRLKKLQECFDPNDLESKPTNKQTEVMEDILSTVKVIRSGNQAGKTATGARETVWKFLDTHPYWERRPEWNKEPLTLVVSSEGHQQLVDIWEQKIHPFLDDSDITVEKDKGYLRRVIHKVNGNKILFIPHNSNAQKKTQGLVCHDFWIDEMPSDKRFVDEALERVQSKQGQLRLTFTPTVINEDIRIWCDDMPKALGRVYILSRLDNPIYADRVEELIAKYEGMPEAEKRMRLHGDWIKPQGAIFDWDKGRNYIPLPDSYNKGWEHIYGIDPAYSGYTGYVLFARDPDKLDWWLIKSGYIKGQAPSDLVVESNKIMEGYNIVRKVYDPHESAFYKEAAKLRIYYTGVYNKTGRKAALVRNLQEMVMSGKLNIARGKNDEAIRELDSAQWSETSDGRIKNSTKYHILDSMQYVVDNLPPAPKKKTQRQMGYYERIIDEHEKQINKDTRQRQGRIKVKRNNRRWKK